MSRRGICLIWFRGPTYLSLNAVPGGKVGSRKQRRANCVQKRSHGPKSRDDSFGTTLQRRMSGGTAFFSLFQTFRQRMRKCSVALRYLNLVLSTELIM